MRKTNETVLIVWALQQRFDYNYGVGLSGFDVEDGNDGHLIINNRRKGIYYDVRVKFHHGEYNCKISMTRDFEYKDSVSMKSTAMYFDDPQEVVDWVIKKIAPSAKTIDINESRSRRGHLVKESCLSPRFTKLLKESSSNADYENYSYICVEVETEDGRYKASWKEGDILNPDDVVEIMKSAEPINGTAVIDTYNKDSETYGDGCSCIVITLSTADNDEEEEMEVCKYWLMPRVDNPEVIDGIADSIEKASEN